MCFFFCFRTFAVADRLILPYRLDSFSYGACLTQNHMKWPSHFKRPKVIFFENNQKTIKKQGTYFCKWQATLLFGGGSNLSLSLSLPLRVKYVSLIFVHQKSTNPSLNGESKLGCQPLAKGFQFSNILHCLHTPKTSPFPSFTSLSLPPPGKRRLVSNSCHCWVVGKNQRWTTVHGDILSLKLTNRPWK